MKTIYYKNANEILTKTLSAYENYLTSKLK